MIRGTLQRRQARYLILEYFKYKKGGRENTAKKTIGFEVVAKKNKQNQSVTVE